MFDHFVGLALKGLLNISVYKIIHKWRDTCPASTKFDYEYYHNSIQKHQYIKNDQNKLLKQYIVSQQIKITFKS